MNLFVDKIKLVQYTKIVNSTMYETEMCYKRDKENIEKGVISDVGNLIMLRSGNVF